MKLKQKIEIRKSIIACCAVVAIVLAGVFLFTYKSVPVLKLDGPSGKIEAANREEIIIPAVLSHLPDDSFPAANVAINFDKDKLQFIGIKIGTMKVYNDYNSETDDTPDYKIPQWTFNAEVANDDGEIRAMYLDTTVGKNAYVQSGFSKGTQDIPFQIVFKLKDSVISGDKLNIEIEEAVFATVNGDVDKTTLSTKENYGKLKVKNTEIVIK